ncbi:uncharacterized protein PHACADRAFT_252915 [Phanerochaete carnosa HHB-10118-sp]|uniref:Arrestin-like N-terminal domain-containing protein n=1 Tax=Phanerochaete carnosa (strain HHB-10118-sp) TaxID=650164 RepID=K5W3R6_PHACS|nr:uncharacterized protein PHACADRAFT_252915 [Phanerochaete carnosa HHB-10118-sp]EKM58518.1 hypothetical protein PHACADRAFT_252915 [Phanerochaete carnosa HHB-10118-sp]
MDKRAEAHAAYTASREDSEAVLPRYSSTSTASLGPELSEHTFQLEDSKGRPWLWLTVKSRAKDKKTWPLYYERDIIHGTVAIDFDKTDGAKAVAISVSGGVTAVGQEELTFLTVSEDLWDSKVSGKAPKGKASWPFSLTLPPEVSASNKPKGKAELYRLPPTFTERASPVYVDYKLIATVRRGAFKVNQILTASIFYTPLSRAEPPSQLRLAAYNADAPLVGPSGDPPGWKVLPPVRFTGTLFNQRTVTLECIAAIAAPLSFATGSPIPLFMTFSSSDEQALDLLCSPSAIRLQLMRERLLGSQATQKGASGQSSNTFREPMAGAYFWPSQDGTVEQGKRQLQGEIDVKKNLRPTFVFPRFSLRVRTVYTDPPICRPG